jgi:hypothetical protein
MEQTGKRLSAGRSRTARDAAADRHGSTLGRAKPRCGHLRKAILWKPFGWLKAGCAMTWVSPWVPRRLETALAAIPLSCSTKGIVLRWGRYWTAGLAFGAWASPHPLPNPSPEGRGAIASFSEVILLPPGEGGGSRMRVRAERRFESLRKPRTLSPPSPVGRGAIASFSEVILLPPGEGGGSRMRVRAERRFECLRKPRTLSPPPLP